MEKTSEIIHNNNYSLSIRFQSDGFSFYVYDESEKLLSKKELKNPVLSATEKAIFQTVANEPESQLVFKNIQLICESGIYTLIPTEFFTEETATNFLHFEQEQEKNEKIIFHHLEYPKSTLISAIPLHFFNAMQKLYPGVTIKHHLAEFLSDKLKNYEKDSLHVLVRSKTIDIVVFKNNNIEMTNSFSYSTPEDFVYFTLNVFEKLSLNNETLQTRIYNLGQKEETKELLKKYINRLSFVED